MNPFGRSWLWLLLALALLATAWVATTPDTDNLLEPALPVRRAGLPAVAAAAVLVSANLPNRLTRASPLVWPKAGAVELAAWGQLPPPAPPPPSKPMLPTGPPPPPSAPQAPSFPYQLIGRFHQGDHAQALVTNQVRTLALRAGEVVDGQWRVDKIDDAALHLTWLPGQFAQSIGYSNPQ